MHGMSEATIAISYSEATIYRYIGGQTSYNISLYWRQVGILYQLLAISGKQFFLEFVITQKIFFFGFSIFSFLPSFQYSSNINPEVRRFGKPNGEICGVDAQAQGGSGEIRKAPTT